MNRMSDEEFDKKFQLNVLGFPISIKSINFVDEEARELFIKCYEDEVKDNN